MNPEKFQFCQKEVEFAGFRISADLISPLPKYLDAIRDFPQPVNITDISLWFGLVNQVSAYGQTRPLMVPFRHLLSSKAPFVWTPDLESAIERGVDIFNPSLPTCLCTDWSKEGLGYHLLQKKCCCTGSMPLCCNAS